MIRLVAAVFGCTALVVLGFSLGGSANTPTGSATATALPQGPFASLHVAGALTVAPDGALYVVDVSRHRVLVRLADGRFRVVAGDGRVGFAGDGGPAVRAELSDISALAVARGGALYIADGGRVRMVGEDGLIRTIAGDGLPARAPLSIALSRSGQLYISTYSQILRLTGAGRLDVVRANVRRGLGAGPLNQIGSIAVTARGGIDAGTLDLGWSIWQVAPNGVARRIGFARCCDGNHAIVQTAPDGIGYGESGGAILRITSRKLVPAFTFAKPVDRQDFSLSYFAFGPTGTIYADDLPGNIGFEAHQQLVSVTAGHVHVLWQETTAPRSNAQHRWFATGSGVRSAVNGLCAGFLTCQAERTSLRVLADRPLNPRVDDAPAQLPDALKRRLEIAHREIRQRERVSGPRTAKVHTDHGTLLARLPALPFAFSAGLKPCTEQFRPKASRAVRIVGRKLDQR